MSIARTTDYATSGPELLIERYKKTKIKALLASWLGEAQQVEDAMWALLTQRSVDNASGAQLDVLGRIVNEPRNGRLDAVYRVWVAARILVLRSLGTPEQIIAITKKLVGAAVPVYLEETPPLAMVVHAQAGISPTIGTQIARLLRQAKSAGAGIQFEWFSSLTGDPLTFAPTLSASVFPSSMGFGNGALTAVSDGTVDVSYDVSSLVPVAALTFDNDDSQLTFDGDADYLTLG